MVQIVESINELDDLLSYIICDKMLVHPICVDVDKHACNNSISLILFHFFNSNTTWCVPIDHNEAICIPDALLKIKDVLKMSISTKLVMDKKTTIQLFGEDYDFVDMGLVKYLTSGIIDNFDSETNAHRFVRTNFRNIHNINMCTPIYKHARAFLNHIEGANSLDLGIVNEEGFKFVNNTITNRFAKLEEIGLSVTEDFTDEFGNEQTKHIKNSLVYTQYNLLTSTGRPSNRFAGVNYAALNKNDDSRKCFVSRYGNDGMLVMMDYNAFHPRLIAHLVNFQMGVDENPYAYLAKYFFNKSDANEEDIVVAKGFTFTQIYGGFDSRWLHIPYFSKIQEYIDHRWKFFSENGYIETPKYKRKIKSCHIPDANPSKLFNYILQAFETEMAVDVLGDLLGDLKDKKTQPILYTYDSILFDVHKDDKMDVIKRLKYIMERDKFPVKVYIGKNYKEMNKINLT